MKTTATNPDVSAQRSRLRLGDRARVRPARPRERVDGSLVAMGYGRRDFMLRRLLAGADYAGMLVAILIASQVNPGRGDDLAFVGLFVLSLPLWTVVFKAYGLYDRDIKRVSHTTLDDLPWIFHAVLVGSLLLWAYYKLVPAEQLVLSEVLTFAGASLVAVTLLRVGVRSITSRVLGSERVLLVGGGPTADLLARKMEAHPEYDLEPVGFVGNGDTEYAGLPRLGDLESLDLEQLVETHSVSRVVVSHHHDLDNDAMLGLIRHCKQLSLKISLLPQLFDAMGPSVEVDDVEGVTVLGINPPVLPRSSRLVKRGLDLLVALPLAILLLPVMVVIAIAIRLDSPGPVLFRQIRTGKGGENFWLVKFRTMTLDAEAKAAELQQESKDPNWLHLDEDPRITRVGKLLRGSSLDELPQLWNVIKGEMSLVGPRPLPEAEDRRVEGWGRSRLDLTPGVTGLWQVLGRTNIPFEEMVKLDYLYVTNWTLWTDVRLILRTLPTVIMKRGAN